MKASSFGSIASIFILSATALAQESRKPQSMGRFEIVKYERKEEFAGKLGKLVSETFVLRKDGKTYSLKLEPFHTLTASKSSKAFCSTCPIEIKKGSIEKSTVRAERKNIVQIEKIHKDR